MESDGVDIDFASIDDFFQSPLRYLVENTVSEGIEGSGGNETYIDAEVELAIRTHEIFSYLSIVLTLASHFGMFLIAHFYHQISEAPNLVIGATRISLCHLFRFCYDRSQRSFLGQ